MSYITPADLDRVLVRAKATDSLGKRIAAALALIEGVVDDLGEDAVALSFNGGKDCTVLLHLFAAVLYERHNAVAAGLQPAHARLPELPAAGPVAPAPALAVSTSTHALFDGPAAPPPPLPPCVAAATEVHATSTHHTPAPASRARSASATTSGTSTPTRRGTGVPYPPIRSVYFTAPNPFPELEAFVLSSAARYAMDLYRFGGGMKAALGEYLDCSGGQAIKAILLGTRTGDPNGNVAVLAPTDASWPQVLRVHPVLDWSYDEVWDFVRELNVPYCELYDEGYTSLGSMHNTSPNPLLARADGGYEPAWKLPDPSQERAGRFKAPPTAPAPA